MRRGPGLSIAAKPLYTLHKGQNTLLSLYASLLASFARGFALPVVSYRPVQKMKAFALSLCFPALCLIVLARSIMFNHWLIE